MASGPGARRTNLRSALLLSTVALAAACLALAPRADAVPACIPTTDSNPYCPVNVVQGYVDALEEPAATGGDIADGGVPAYEACWESLSAPAYDSIDQGVGSASLGNLTGGCGNPHNGGVTVYYPKAYMHHGYDHGSNFNHKLSNWMHLYRAKGCNSTDCTMRTYLTNSRNLVKSGSEHTGWAEFVGADFGRTAARAYCGWIYGGYFNVAPPKPLVNCYYTYG